MPDESTIFRSHQEMKRPKYLVVVVAAVVEGQENVPEDKIEVWPELEQALWAHKYHAALHSKTHRQETRVAPDVREDGAATARSFLVQGACRLVSVVWFVVSRGLTVNNRENQTFRMTLNVLEKLVSCCEERGDPPIILHAQPGLQLPPQGGLRSL